jgi:hypothetical protein
MINEMTSSELRAKLLQHGRRPLGKLIQMPLKQEGKILFADVKNDRAYSYFLVDLETSSVREGHIYERYRKKVFGAFNVPYISLA